MLFVGVIGIMQAEPAPYIGVQRTVTIVFPYDQYCGAMHLTTLDSCGLQRLLVRCTSTKKFGMTHVLCTQKHMDFAEMKNLIGRKDKISPNCTNLEYKTILLDLFVSGLQTL